MFSCPHWKRRIRPTGRPRYPRLIGLVQSVAAPPSLLSLSGRRTCAAMDPTPSLAVAVGLSSQSTRHNHPEYTANGSPPLTLDSAASRRPITSTTA